MKDTSHGLNFSNIPPPILPLPPLSPTRQLMRIFNSLGDGAVPADFEREQNLLHVRELESICWRRASALREEAQAQVHRPARCVVLREQADTLEAEASTWKLMRYVNSPL